MAASLARMIDLVLPFVDLPGLPRHGYPRGRVWDGSHNALFETAGAAATHLLAYTARCEHCYGLRPEPDSAQRILRNYTAADPANILASFGPAADG